MGRLPSPTPSDPSAESHGRRAVLLVFLLALLARLLFVWLQNPPILFAHPYTYFDGALRIVEHAQPVDYVLRSEEWRTWDRHWTIAPLYYLYLAGFFTLFGASLAKLQLLQCLTESLVAAGVARLGQRLAGPAGAWGGLVYAFHLQALDLPTQTLTENLHTPLLLAGVLLLARDSPSARDGRRVFGAGLLVGLSALTRSVSSAFIPILALLEWNRTRDRAGLARAARLCAGAALVILPWSARNAFVIGDPVPIETTAYENILWANHLGPPEDYRRHIQALDGLATPAERRAYATQVAVTAIRQHPDLFARKAWSNFWHLIRPEGLDGLLRLERSSEPWGHLKGLVLDDPFLVAALVLVGAFLFGSAPTPARALVLSWCGYFCLMVVVFFHNEVRYRLSLWPYVAAAMAAGLIACRQADATRRRRALAGALAGLLLSGLDVAPYVAPAVRSLAAWRELQPALAAARRGDVPAARPLLERVSATVPQAAWPHVEVARALAAAGQAQAAVDACRSALERGTPETTVARLMLPSLLQAAGRESPARQALRTAHQLSWNADPWLTLEVAWAALPAPRSDEIEVGGLDYGAVRGFLHSRGIPGAPRRWRGHERVDGPPGAHRWSRGRAWLRVVPVTPAPAYEATLWLGVPPPGRLAPGARAQLRCGASVTVCELTASVAPCRLRVAAPAPGQALSFELRVPTWSRAGEPADQGARVERLTLTPLH